tara:strand:- start:508 stop:720 length:213 start_codon:yes stop_codon:yes gene_type:complete
MFFMSGEQIANTGEQTRLKSSLNKEKQKKVNINILFNKIREQEKKEKFGNIIAFGLIATLILATGIIISL